MNCSCACTAEAATSSATPSSADFIAFMVLLLTISIFKRPVAADSLARRVRRSGQTRMLPPRAPGGDRMLYCSS
jgi:hypothetical protein